MRCLGNRCHKAAVPGKMIVVVEEVLPWESDQKVAICGKLVVVEEASSWESVLQYNG